MSILLKLADVQVHQEVRQLAVLVHELLRFLHLNLRPDQLDGLRQFAFIITHVTDRHEWLLLVRRGWVVSTGARLLLLLLLLIIVYQLLLHYLNLLL